jgi:hypothetical protein
MQIKLDSLAVVVSVVATGCAMGWTRPNTSAAEFHQDRYQCEREAASMYPVTMTASGPGYQAPAQTNCSTYGRQTNCTTTPGTYTPPPTYDANAIARSSAVSSCLQAKGYIFKIGN